MVRLKQKQSNVYKKSHPLKFETAWLFDKTCEKVVHEMWSDNTENSMIEKLSVLGHELKAWSKRKF